MQYGSPVKGREKTLGQDMDTSFDSIDASSTISANSFSSPSKKVTPYSLYIRENYVALKAQCSDDKKVIFAKCNEMWEEEPAETKQMYERKAQEEISSMQDESAKALSAVDSPSVASLQSPRISRNLNLVNEPMALETAAQFASLVAARHVDTSTRDCNHLNINTIREQSSVSAHGLEEI